MTALSPSAISTVIVVVAMIMIMIMVMIVPELVRVRAEQLLRRDGLLRHIGELKSEIDDLVLKDRHPQLEHGIRIVLVIVENLTLLSGELLGALHDGAADLLIGHRHLITLADLRQDEPEPNTALGHLAIFRARLVFSGPLILEAFLRMLKLMRHLVPYSVEFAVDKGRRQLETMRLVQRVQKSALGSFARGPAIILCDLLADRVLELA